MAKNISELAAEAIIIQEETDASENTASRVGTMFIDIIDYLGTLNTSSGSEDEGGSGGGGGGGVSLNEPLSSINNMARTPSGENKVLVYQNGTWTYDDYGGGSTPTSGVTWTALGAATSEPINLSHLTGALGNCSFWGRNPVYDATSGHMTVSGNMTDVGSITMRYNNDDNRSVKIEVDEYGNLKFNGNIYATGGVSALGNSSSGGGGGGGSIVSWTQLVTSGTKIATVTIDSESTDVYAPTSGGAGGATTLGGLNDVTLGSLDDGHYLRYNSSNSKWVNGQFSSLITTLNAIPDSINNGSYLINYNGGWSLTKYEQSSSGISADVSGTGNVVIDARLSSNVLTLTKGSLPVASANTLGGFKTGSNTGLTLNTNTGVLSLAISGVTSDTYTQVTVDKYGRVTVGANPNTLAGYGITDAVKNSTTWWGRPIGSNNTVTGNMTNVGSITMSGYINMNNNTGISIKDTYSNHDPLNVFGLNQSNALYIGYGTRLYGYTTDIQGGQIAFITNNGVKNGTSSPLSVGAFYENGQFHVKQGDQGIRIGDGVIKWNSSNNSLYVERAADAGGGVANFYASGGVSALGFSSTNGRNASVDYLVADSISVSGDITDQADVWHIDSSEFYHEVAVGASEVNASRFYISPNNFTPSSGNTNCILYAKKVNGVNKLYFYNGSSEIQIA